VHKDKGHHHLCGTVAHSRGHERGSGRGRVFEAATLKSAADIRKHVTSAKVELLTSLQGVVWVLNNYYRLLNVLFGPDCPHLTHIISLQDGLETHKAELESRLTGVLILHLMWRVHHDARQFF